MSHSRSNLSVGDTLTVRLAHRNGFFVGDGEYSTEFRLHIDSNEHGDLSEYVGETVDVEVTRVSPSSESDATLALATVRDLIPETLISEAVTRPYVGDDGKSASTTGRTYSKKARSATQTIERKPKNTSSRGGGSLDEIARRYLDTELEITGDDLSEEEKRKLKARKQQRDVARSAGFDKIGN